MPPSGLAGGGCVVRGLVGKGGRVGRQCCAKGEGGCFWGEVVLGGEYCLGRRECGVRKGQRVVVVRG